MIIFYRPLHFLVLTITVPLSIYYFVLTISDMRGRLQRKQDTISPQELELFEWSLQLDERKPVDGVVTAATTISWDDLVDEAMLKPILDLDGPKKWLKLQATNLISSERKLEKRSIHDLETPSVHSNGSALQYNLMVMDENSKLNRHPISYNCTVEYVNKNRLQQDHPCVIDVIRRIDLHRPSSLPLTSNKMDHSNVTVPSDKESIQINSILRTIHNQVQSNGFFVDCCGSDDKEFLSNTLYMETTLGWQGLLINPWQQSPRKLPFRNQNLSSLPICLSPEVFPVKMALKAKNKSEEYITQCFPLYSVLLALNRTKIDFIRLNTGTGFELRILKTIPWDKVNITLLSMQSNHIPAGEEVDINRYMKKCGFTKSRQVSAVNHSIHNHNKVSNFINTNFLKSVQFGSF